MDVLDYVANGSFAALKENVEYRSGSGYAVLVRLVDHNANWHGERVYVDESAYLFLSKSALFTGDIVIANVGANAGTVFRVPALDRPATLGPNAVLVRPKKDISARISKDFLYYYLASPVGQAKLQSLITGSAQPKFNKTALRGLHVEFPPMSVQQSIAEIMLAVDDRITLLRETNATLEAIAQALFKSWFVDFDPVRAKAEGRQPEGMDAATASLFPDSFEESELGLVPKGWEVKSVGDVVIVTDYVANGSFAALKENVTLLDQRSYALYVRTTDHNSGFSGGFRYVDKSAYDFLSKSSLLGNEVIISNVGDVGTVFRPPRWLGMPMTLGSNAVALKAPQMSAFLFFHFSGAKGQHDIHSVVTGSAQLKFNKTNFRSLKLLLPPESCLSEFEEKASLLLEAADNNRAKIQTLTQLRDTLLPRLISGQLRLPEAEALLEDNL